MNNLVISKLIPGDIILTNGRGIRWGSLPIKLANFFKRGYKERHWTHAALYIGDGQVVEAFPGGIVKRDFKESYLKGDFELLILRHKNASQLILQKTIDFCKNSVSKGYDFRALLYFLFYNLTPPQIHFIWGDAFLGRCFNLRDAYFCSELVCTGLLVAGVYCFEREPYKVMPVDFNNKLLFDTVTTVELPYKENRFIHSIKVAFFQFLYFVTAMLFFLILLVVAILLIALFILFVAGVGGIILFFIGLFKSIPLTIKKKEDDSQKKT
ncbi:MAG: hypothetical protein Q8L26_08675 [Candidatus Omnitrophota bacterium]|nr:hypothetical protein [Candidatus Omnitrophota bacterium]